MNSLSHYQPNQSITFPTTHSLPCPPLPLSTWMTLQVWQLPVKRPWQGTMRAESPYVFVGRFLCLDGFISSFTFFTSYYDSQLSTPIPPCLIIDMFFKDLYNIHHPAHHYLQVNQYNTKQIIYSSNKEMLLIPSHEYHVPLISDISC